MIKNIFKSSLLGQSLVYTISNFLNSGINFLLVPVLTRYIPVSEYGLLTMFSLLITFLTPFVGLNIHGAITRKYFQKDQVEFEHYVGTCIVLLLVSTVVVVISFFLLKSILFELTDLEWKYILVITIICFSQFVNLTLLSIWQAQKRAVWYAIMQVSVSLINIGLSLYFIIGLDSGWEGRVYGQLIATFAASIISIYILLSTKLMVITFDLNHAKHALKFSLPLIPHSVGAVVISLTDRFILKNTLGLVETGLYMLAYQLASVLAIGTSAFNSAFIPWLYGKLNSANYSDKLKIVKLTYFMMIGLILMFIVLSIAANIIWPLIVGIEYQNAFKYFPLILLSFVFNGMYLLVTNYLFYCEKTSILGILTFAVALLNIPLTYAFIYMSPYNGAAIGLAISSALMFILTWYFASKYYQMPWSLKVRSIS
jgi:O-antigen/teichoic acid export membrane protein